MAEPVALLDLPLLARAALAGREEPTETDEEDNEAAMQAIRDGLAGREETA